MHLGGSPDGGVYGQQPHQALMINFTRAIRRSKPKHERSNNWIPVTTGWLSKPANNYFFSKGLCIPRRPLFFTKTQSRNRAIFPPGFNNITDGKLGMMNRIREMLRLQHQRTFKVGIG